MSDKAPSSPASPSTSSATAILHEPQTTSAPRIAEPKLTPPPEAPPKGPNWKMALWLLVPADGNNLASDVTRSGAPRS
jgi:hypothetical protein